MKVFLSDDWFWVFVRLFVFGIPDYPRGPPGIPGAETVTQAHKNCLSFNKGSIIPRQSFLLQHFASLRCHHFQRVRSTSMKFCVSIGWLLGSFLQMHPGAHVLSEYFNQATCSAFIFQIQDFDRDHERLVLGRKYTKHLFQYKAFQKHVLIQ